MTISRRSTTNAKNGQSKKDQEKEDIRKKGLAHFESLHTLAVTNKDDINAKRYLAIIKRLENDISKKK
jgi:hypothetical protein